tara:strand:+ start:7469 stop:9283 length:1815 start_codon:yes stop_codon:yes gene_type:complete
MKILSIYQSMPASVSLLIDNKIVAAVQEERFTRKKNDEEFPKRSIEYCINYADIQPNQLDAIAVASLISPFDDQLVRKSQWTVNDYLIEQHRRWKPYLVDKTHETLKSLQDIFPEKIDLEAYPSHFWRSLYQDQDRQGLYSEKRLALFADHLEVPRSKVYAVDHHKSHAYYSYYSSHFRKERVLALTVDGWGDGINATVGIFEEDGCYKRFYETDQCAIARIYRYITLLLGMKPNEHEYKLMGLAPYGKAEHGEVALEVFRRTLQVDGIGFAWQEKPTDSYFWFKERLEGCRFDSIAWALQTWVEELLLEWVDNCIDKFNIKKVVLSGGVAMNIKAMGRLVGLSKLDDLFVGGSAGDESLAIGSAFCLAEDLERSKTGGWCSSGIESLSHLNLGPHANKDTEIETVADLDPNQFLITNEIENKEIARLLADGQILARCAGRMEFGQRALGNRSILADPIRLENKERINSAIKNRDFWMPFAPVVLDTYVDQYLVNSKGIRSPHMTIGFQTTDRGYDAMKAACHPADRSVRPQILREDSNPGLYLILKEFEELTGRGALLNTSFNLHGYPIVNTPQEALSVFLNSQLDGLILNSCLVLRKQNSAH